ncbi:hypothetical protein BPA_0900026 (plasmid) [Borrelia parkeri SLO]|uniref:Uncharacterized protein n=1 Tax=Borrelia parkeri SLO TaxID=1313294 RepID=W5ST90_BORPR|nr:hypothetical protein BPA_0900026 [Borrelia parkeri SLO]
MPSDLAACPSLGEEAELLQDISKNKVINNAQKVILFIITCLLINLRELDQTKGKQFL